VLAEDVFGFYPVGTPDGWFRARRDRARPPDAAMTVLASVVARQARKLNCHLVASQITGF
jgi:hypothetical protein